MNHKLKNFLFILNFIIALDFIGASPANAALEPGIPFPVFTLSSLDGQEVVLQDYLGKVVIIHLWKCQ